MKSLSLALGIACISSQNLVLAQQRNDDALHDGLGRQSAIKQENTAQEPAIATGVLPQAGDDSLRGTQASLRASTQMRLRFKRLFAKPYKICKRDAKRNSRPWQLKLPRHLTVMPPSGLRFIQHRKNGSSHLQACGMSSPQLTGMPGCNLQVSYPKCHWQLRSKPKTG